jgi:hypothetical protein
LIQTDHQKKKRPIVRKLFDVIIFSKENRERKRMKKILIGLFGIVFLPNCSSAARTAVQTLGMPTLPFNLFVHFNKIAATYLKNNVNSYEDLLVAIRDLSAEEFEVIKEKNKLHVQELLQNQKSKNRVSRCSLFWNKKMRGQPVPSNWRSIDDQFNQALKRSVDSEAPDLLKALQYMSARQVAKQGADLFRCWLLDVFCEKQKEDGFIYFNSFISIGDLRKKITENKMEKEVAEKIRLIFESLSSFSEEKSKKIVGCYVLKMNSALIAKKNSGHNRFFSNIEAIESYSDGPLEKEDVSSILDLQPELGVSQKTRILWLLSVFHWGRGKDRETFQALTDQKNRICNKKEGGLSQSAVLSLQGPVDDQSSAKKNLFPNIPVSVFANPLLKKDVKLQKKANEKKDMPVSVFANPLLKKDVKLQKKANEKKDLFRNAVDPSSLVLTEKNPDLGSRVRSVRIRNLSVFLFDQFNKIAMSYLKEAKLVADSDQNFSDCLHLVRELSKEEFSIIQKKIKLYTKTFREEHGKISTVARCFLIWSKKMRLPEGTPALNTENSFEKSFYRSLRKPDSSEKAEDMMVKKGIDLKKTGDAGLILFRRWILKRLFPEQEKESQDPAFFISVGKVQARIREQNLEQEVKEGIRDFFSQLVHSAGSKELKKYSNFLCAIFAKNNEKYTAYSLKSSTPEDLKRIESVCEGPMSKESIEQIIKLNPIKDLNQKSKLLWLLYGFHWGRNNSIEALQNALQSLSYSVSALTGQSPEQNKILNMISAVKPAEAEKDLGSRRRQPPRCNFSVSLFDQFNKIAMNYLKEAKLVADSDQNFSEFLHLVRELSKEEFSIIKTKIKLYTKTLRSKKGKSGASSNCWLFWQKKTRLPEGTPALKTEKNLEKHFDRSLQNHGESEKEEAVIMKQGTDVKKVADTGLVLFRRWILSKLFPERCEEEQGPSFFISVGDVQAKIREQSLEKEVKKSIVSIFSQLIDGVREVEVKKYSRALCMFFAQDLEKHPVHSSRYAIAADLERIENAYEGPMSEDHARHMLKMHPIKDLNQKSKLLWLLYGFHWGRDHSIEEPQNALQPLLASRSDPIRESVQHNNQRSLNMPSFLQRPESLKKEPAEKNRFMPSQALEFLSQPDDQNSRISEHSSVSQLKNRVSKLKIEY